MKRTYDIQSKFFSWCPRFADEWRREEFHYKKLDHGKWELVVPPKEDGSCRIAHDSCLKVSGKVKVKKA